MQCKSRFVFVFIHLKLWKRGVLLHGTCHVSTNASCPEFVKFLSPNIQTPKLFDWFDTSPQLADDH